MHGHMNVKSLAASTNFNVTDIRNTATTTTFRVEIAIITKTFAQQNWHLRRLKYEAVERLILTGEHFWKWFNDTSGS